MRKPDRTKLPASRRAAALIGLETARSPRTEESRRARRHGWIAREMRKPKSGQADGSWRAAEFLRPETPGSPRTEESRRAPRHGWIAREMRKPNRARRTAAGALLLFCGLRLLVRHGTNRERPRLLQR